MNKCKALGLNNKLIQFLEDFFAERTATVVLQGARSEKYKLENQIYQGTVLGPPFWNIFFRDVCNTAEVHDNSIYSAKFADDLNIFKEFDRSETSNSVFEALVNTQQKIHHWGAENRITFDTTKEHMVIISQSQASGDPFKLLGARFDPKLLMDLEIDRIVKKCRAKMTALE